MEKKSSSPEQESSALESAWAALDKAGETEASEADATEPVQDARATDSESVNDAATPDPEEESDAPEEEEASDGAGDAPEDTEEDAETPDETSEEDGDAYDDEEEEDADDEPEEEVGKTERHTMETREITLGGHRNAEPDEDAREAEYEREEDERDTKERRPKKRGAGLEKLWRSLLGNGTETKKSGSSRDAALRRRVEQMPKRDAETKNYLLDRVLPQMTWYSKKSAQYQQQYYRFMAATIFLGALIPVLALLADRGWIKVVIALLGASVTAINAYLALHNYHDLWLTYRTAREDLIHILYCYFNRAGMFSKSATADSDEDLNVLLVNACEEVLSKENRGWTTIVQKTTESRAANTSAE